MWQLKDKLQTPLRYLRGVGPKREALFQKKGFLTWWDLLLHFPFRQEDRRDITPIRDCNQLNTGYCIVGKVLETHVSQTRRGIAKVEATLADDTGFIGAIWYGRYYIVDRLQRGKRYRFYGKFKRFPYRHLANPEFEAIEEKTQRTGGILPVYPSIGPFKSPQIQRYIHRILQELPDEDYLPKAWETKALPTLKQALFMVHQPTHEKDIQKGRARFAYDEALIFQARVMESRLAWKEEAEGVIFHVDDTLRNLARMILPFPLTKAQKRVVREMIQDVTTGKRMHRLLEGDVGSGKTIVALLIALVAMRNGYQTAWLAPTGILADQHYQKIARLLSQTPYKVELLTSATSATKRKKILASLKEGSLPFILGTHALLEKDIHFHRLGFVVVDEQHRFGVAQRKALRDKGQSPHYLVMTATPIPRTLALVFYGDLDVSILDEMPPGRGETRTYLRREGAREKIYAFIRQRLEKGEQAYIVYPLIEESEHFDVHNLLDHSQKASPYFAPYKTAILHGKMPSKEKEKIMRRFASGAIQVLFTTTVIEVGVDVPQATVMLIEGAERYGLAQLHQLRGRIGRGKLPSYCILIHKAYPGSLAYRRLQAFASCRDGFQLAEMDLELRGPGDLTGLRQWGLPNFRFLEIPADLGWLRLARQKIEENLKKDPHAIHELLRCAGPFWKEQGETLL